MVRLDKCVEALYDSVTADTRTRNLQILTVMKGAISMSRSKTGECIFRTNKRERRNLERLIKIEGRNANYSISQIDSRRKTVISRWSKVLQDQTTCSSEALFEELMEIDDGLDNNHEITVRRDSPVHHDSPEPRDIKLKTLIELRLAKLEDENNTSGFATVMASRRRHMPNSYIQDETADDTSNVHSEKEFVTERKEIRSKYMEENGKEITNKEQGPTMLGTVLSKSQVVQLPSVHRQNIPAESKSAEVTTPTLERDPTDWRNWSLNDKSRIKGYLQREKTRHEDLIIRNALNKIETDMSGANTIRRQQMRQKLQNERQQREAEIRRQERAQKEAEISREIAILSSATGKSSSSSGNTIITCKTPPTVKHVAFKEPLNIAGNSVSQSRISGIRQTNKSKKRYKPVSTIMNHLPAIQEDSRHGKVTSAI
ncbi:uncharacterized protein LOC123533641 [Mercenaria mercenaria]|uniref:uncharacterized protein LOC123533641 n=1 Tax=Mercenaria mercenaria TaxID=6596 RepID=UPI00234F8FFB|nr:uncharacterized protein LOC123533641 [Mercenaria mercenaria]XP_045171306.2 uncharacterized protein LOC123533641 [Mercenaria mercenaria]